MLTIDQLLFVLESSKKNPANKLGGDAVVHLVIPEMPYAPIIDAKLEADDSGAVVVLFVADEHLVVPTPHVVIDVEGGVVQNVTSDQPIKVLLLDQDNIEAGDTEPEWGYPVDYDYKRVSVLKDNPAAEIDNDPTEFKLVVDVARSEDYIELKRRIDATIGGKPEITEVEPMDGKVRLVYQFSFNGDCSDARKRLTDAKLPEVLEIDPT